LLPSFVYIPIFIFTNSSFTGAGCHYVAGFFSPYYITVAWLCIINVYVIIKLWRVKEAYGLRNYFLWVIIYTIILALCFTNIAQYVPNIDNYFEAAYIYNILGAIWITHNICYPAYLTFYRAQRHEMRRTTSFSDMSRPLLKLLATEDGYVVLLDYAKKEFNAETLLFWKAVEDFRAKPSYDMAVSIISSYITEDSPLQINISYTNHKELMEVYTNYISTNKREDTLKDDYQFPDKFAEMFDLSQREIIHVIEFDTLSRFRATPEAAKFKHLFRPSTSAAALEVDSPV